MDTAPELTALFERHSKNQFVIVNVKGADAEIQDTGMVALRATILDAHDLKPSGAEIIVQMLPIDAGQFANSVNEAAKTKAWKFPGDAKFIRWQENSSQE